MEVKEKELRILTESWTRFEGSSMVVEYKNWKMVFSMPGRSCEVSYRGETQLYMDCPSLREVYEILFWVDEAEVAIEEQEKAAVMTIVSNYRSCDWKQVQA